MFRHISWLLVVVVVICMFGPGTTQSWAQTAEDVSYQPQWDDPVADPNASQQQQHPGDDPMFWGDPNHPTTIVSFHANVQWTTVYFFRGILQTSKGFILQPGGDVLFDLPIPTALGEGTLDRLWFKVGNWNSLSTGDAAVGGHHAGWQELDVYADFGATFAGGVQTSIQMMGYTSPANSFEPTLELSGTLAWDWRPEIYRFKPEVNVRFWGQLAAEVYHSRTPGKDEGIWLGIGVTPSLSSRFMFFDRPLTIAVPVEFGFGLDNYYGNKGAEFGYCLTGVDLSLPIGSIDPAYGRFIITNSCRLLIPNSVVHQSDDPYFVFSLGMAWEF